MKKAVRSTAIVVRGAERLPVPLPAAMPIAVPLGSTPSMSAQFVGTFKLTADQIAALRKPVQDHELDWRPAEKDGPPIIPFLSHNGYRDRLDAAFGLGGWGMVAVGLPQHSDDHTYLIPFALVVDGVQRIYAWGEQARHKMSYGDALEGAKSNAITRCGKELGIARELWDRKHVKELQARRGRPASDERGTAPPAGSHAREDEPITDPQRKRLFAIMKSSGRDQSELAVWLAARYQITDTSKIKRRDYDAICKAVEAWGPLPVPEED